MNPQTARTSIQKKVDACREVLRQLESVVVAFSGGEDSAFLLALAAETLGRDKVLAVMVVSSIFPQTKRQLGRRRAREIGVELVELEVPELTDLTFICDPAESFHCKKRIFNKLKGISASRNMDVVVSGMNVDEVEDPRFLSLEDAKRLGLRRPLMEADMSGADVHAAFKTMLPAI